MEYMRQSEKFWETFILPEIAFSCFRFALLSSWPKFWMDQFFWENCAGTPVQNFPTILKTLKMMMMIIIGYCWICFEIVLFLLISNSVFFVWLCALLCADVMHRNLASHFFYHPIFVLVTCAPPLCNQPSWLLHFQRQHFFWGGTFCQLLHIGWQIEHSKLKLTFQIYLGISTLGYILFVTWLPSHS